MHLTSVILPTRVNVCVLAPPPTSLSSPFSFFINLISLAAARMKSHRDHRRGRLHASTGGLQVNRHLQRVPDPALSGRSILPIRDRFIHPAYRTGDEEARRVYVCGEFGVLLDDHRERLRWMHRIPSLGLWRRGRDRE